MGELLNKAREIFDGAVRYAEDTLIDSGVIGANYHLDKFQKKLSLPQPKTVSYFLNEIMKVPENLRSQAFLSLIKLDNFEYAGYVVDTSEGLLNSKMVKGLTAEELIHCRSALSNVFSSLPANERLPVFKEMMSIGLHSYKLPRVFIDSWRVNQFFMAIPSEQQPEAFKAFMTSNVCIDKFSYYDDGHAFDSMLDRVPKDVVFESLMEALNVNAEGWIYEHVHTVYMGLPPRKLNIFTRPKGENDLERHDSIFFKMLRSLPLDLQVIAINKSFSSKGFENSTSGHQASWSEIVRALPREVFGELKRELTLMEDGSGLIGAEAKAGIQFLKATTYCPFDREVAPIPLSQIAPLFGEAVRRVVSKNVAPQLDPATVSEILSRVTGLDREVA